MNTYRIADVNIAYTPRCGNTAAFLASYQTDITQPALTIELSPSDLEAEAALLGTVSDDVLEATALLRALSTRLVDRDRLVLHAAAVVKDNAAYAFIAPSGTGKTTHAILWQKRYQDRAFILNGDRLFLHIQQNGTIAFGSPWCGKEGIGRNTSAPLRGIFVLTRSDAAYCERVSPTDALPHLLRATAFLKAQSVRLKILTLLETLTVSVPCYHLHAPLSLSAVDAAVARLEELP